MKSKILLGIGLSSACIGCAHAQSVGPSAAPVAAVSPATTPRAGQQWAQAQDAYSAAQNAYAQSTRNYAVLASSSSRSSSDSVPPVVIQFGAKDSSVIAAMEEDLAIMTHLIDRAIERSGENGPDEKLGVPLYYTSGGKSVRALYLEGFGPLFMVKVNFPVHAAAAAGENRAAEKQEDSEWEKARRTLYGVNEDTRWMGVSSGVPYEAARVEALKKHLIPALKNASNMKGVKPDEFVNVSVFGSPDTIVTEARPSKKGPRTVSSLPSQKTVTPRSDPASEEAFDTDAKPQPYRTTLEVARTTLQGTVLTLRAKKSDIDAAAKGSLDDAAFARKVTANSYAGNGHGLTSVNSWLRRSTSSSGAMAR
jgi:hypothetical protein